MLERSPRGKATDFIAFASAYIFLLPFLAQKSHVKSQNHLTHSNETRSSLHFSSTQSAILKIVEKNKQAPEGYSIPPGLTRLERRF
jgi:hypothetical protein